MPKTGLRAARWLAAPAVVAPTALLVPQLAALEAVLATVWMLGWIRVRFAPAAYEKPVWWCRLKLEWWAWRAERRRRGDPAQCWVEPWADEL